MNLKLKPPTPAQAAYWLGMALLLWCGWKAGQEPMY
jgi:threonine/homoserine/homoserine lactone efflux protein